MEKSKFFLIFAKYLRQLATKIFMQKEIWKPIKGYDGYFEVSNYGNFKSLDRIVGYKQLGTYRKYPGKSLKTETTLEGYTRIVLMKNHIKKRYMCHRIVAETFIPNPQNKPFVNHKNGNQTHNFYSVHTSSTNAIFLSCEIVSSPASIVI